MQVWIMVVVAVLSATMSESAIDSLQNAIVDNISGTFLKLLPLVWTRVLVCVLNIPVMVVSLQVRLSFESWRFDKMLICLTQALSDAQYRHSCRSSGDSGCNTHEE